MPEVYGDGGQSAWGGIGLEQTQIRLVGIRKVDDTSVSRQTGPILPRERLEGADGRSTGHRRNRSNGEREGTPSSGRSGILPPNPYIGGCGDDDTMLGKNGQTLAH